MRQDRKSAGTPTVAALGRSLAVLEAILTDQEASSLSVLAERIGIPRATVHRQIRTLLDEGFLRRLPGGPLIAGQRLVALAQTIDQRLIVVAVAAPVLQRLAGKTGCVVQLGTLENDMVTYRSKTGKAAETLFTRVGMQLEAYCTGIGKVLLAHLPEAELRAYLSNGPFPALTPNTITNAQKLYATLQLVRKNGFARDDEEITIGLNCLAVPLACGGEVPAAISIANSSSKGMSDEDALAALRAAAAEIAQDLLESDPQVHAAWKKAESEALTAASG